MINWYESRTLIVDTRCSILRLLVFQQLLWESQLGNLNIFVVVKVLVVVIHREADEDRHLTTRQNQHQSPSLDNNDNGSSKRWLCVIRVWAKPQRGTTRTKRDGHDGHGHTTTRLYLIIASTILATQRNASHGIANHMKSWKLLSY